MNLGSIMTLYADLVARQLRMMPVICIDVTRDTLYGSW